MGLLRTKSLISNRQDSFEFRYPIVLNCGHPIVNKLIEFTHRKLNHAQTEITMNRLREQYSIIKSRCTIKSVIQKCIICKRYDAKKIETSPVALPENRVRDATTFEITVYRAIHLELVTSLSTELFLEAFRRFVARRGRPCTVYTDNGTNFTRASRNLQEINWTKVEEYGSVEKIQSIFNPPSAAWWGGWWERLVRSVKEILRKVLRQAFLNYEELTTILCDCEAIINSRPITYIAEEPHQLIPLSPALFLQDTRNSGIPDLDAIASAEKLNKRIKYRQTFREHLRQRFRSEYLGQLSRKNNRRSQASQTNIDVGDVLLIGSDQLKRLDWPLGKVIQIFPGQDGKIRVAKLQTASGELVRPVQRLYSLKLSTAEASEESRQFKDQYKQSSNAGEPSSLSEAKRVTSENGGISPENEITEQTEKRTRSGRRIITPAKLLD
ncbi:uncharacterized protein [Mycetomoellerius zeteki]|uniref:uncharacterized protein n=1 Tax=Mycetomoellerius zeteki TaxID=64791 RepID=UPI00084EBB15|nr:PREDICTED: uncharacterized protein LOC108722745 [Trachymyrmex zeteki]